MCKDKKKIVNPTYQQPVFCILAGLLILCGACVLLGAWPKDRYTYERNLCVVTLTVLGTLLSGTGACMCCARQEASNNTHREWQRRQKLYKMPPEEDGPDDLTARPLLPLIQHQQPMSPCQYDQEAYKIAEVYKRTLKSKSATQQLASSMRRQSASVEAVKITEACKQALRSKAPTQQLAQTHTPGPKGHHPADKGALSEGDKSKIVDAYQRAVRAMPQSTPTERMAENIGISYSGTMSYNKTQAYQEPGNVYHKPPTKPSLIKAPKSDIHLKDAHSKSEEDLAKNASKSDCPARIVKSLDAVECEDDDPQVSQTKKASDKSSQSSRQNASAPSITQTASKVSRLLAAASYLTGRTSKSSRSKSSKSSQLNQSAVSVSEAPELEAMPAASSSINASAKSSKFSPGKMPSVSESQLTETESSKSSVEPDIKAMSAASKSSPSAKSSKSSTAKTVSNTSASDGSKTGLTPAASESVKSGLSSQKTLSNISMSQGSEPDPSPVQSLSANVSAKSGKSLLKNLSTADASGKSGKSSQKALSKPLASQGSLSDISGSRDSQMDLAPATSHSTNASVNSKGSSKESGSQITPAASHSFVKSELSSVQNLSATSVSQGSDASPAASGQSSQQATPAASRSNGPSVKSTKSEMAMSDDPDLEAASSKSGNTSAKSSHTLHRWGSPNSPASRPLSKDLSPLLKSSLPNPPSRAISLPLTVSEDLSEDDDDDDTVSGETYKTEFKLNLNSPSKK